MNFWSRRSRPTARSERRALVAGGNDESIFQPTWSPDGTLYFASDRSNWWNLYAERDGKVVPVLPMEAEFGTPQWVFGMTTFGFQPDGTIIARATQAGRWSLLRIDPKSGKSEAIKLPYTNISSIDVAGRPRLPNRRLAD